MLELIEQDQTLYSLNFQLKFCELAKKRVCIEENFHSLAATKHPCRMPSA